ncbi:phasin family protein [Noviherbaspirillum cavernae]|nr:phasin family protein [Noviherbaspirillum cavernae]
MRTEASPLVTMYQAQLDASRRFADAFFSSAEKIDHIFIESTRRTIERQLKFAQAMAGVRDSQDAATRLRSDFFARGPNDAVSDQKEIMSVFAEMQNELGQSLHDYVEQLGVQTGTAPMAATEVTQNPSDAAGNPLAGMYSVWESIFKEAIAVAGKNMLAAQATIDESTRRSMGTAENLASAVSDSTSGLTAAHWMQGLGASDAHQGPSGRKSSSGSKHR